MLGRTTGAVLFGIESRLVDVEVDLGRGLPTISAVGLPDSAVREGIDRVRAALQNAGFELPDRRIIVNLAPAEVRKQGAALDLPIAGALLLAARQLTAAFDIRRVVMVGELGLDGSLRPVRGMLSRALAAREEGRGIVLVPRDNADEATLVEGLQVVPLSTLADLAAVCRGMWLPHPPTRVLERLEGAGAARGPDLSEVRGQAAARRALEVAAAGGHHLLFVGPPGSGKSMLARRIPGILPPMTVEEALEVTRIHSAARHVRGLLTRRPFRAPHHGVSLAGLTGGGPRMRPGEISLASHGVLFLDELTEFRRDVLEALRQPLEDGEITVVRVHGAVTFPARFMLVASMNPCPCGYHGSPDGRCNCTPPQVRRYCARLSGPLLDRFDLVIEVPAVDPDALTDSPPGEESAPVRGRVLAARQTQRARFAASGPLCNAGMDVSELDDHAALDADGRRLLLAACDRLGLSARGFQRVRRVARTIADLEGSETIAAPHVAEALQYRRPATLARD